MGFKYCLLVLVATEKNCKREIFDGCGLLLFQLLLGQIFSTLDLLFRLFEFGQLICKEGLQELQFLASESAFLFSKCHVLDPSLRSEVFAGESQQGG